MHPGWHHLDTSSHGVRAKKSTTGLTEVRTCVCPTVQVVLCCSVRVYISIDLYLGFQVAK